MDQTTHEVRRKQWLSIITECQARPEGTTVREWLSENNIKEKAYYYWLRKFRKEAYEKLPSVSGKQPLKKMKKMQIMNLLRNL